MASAKAALFYAWVLIFSLRCPAIAFNDIFLPFDMACSHNFTLKSLQKVPYYIQFKGTVVWKDGSDKYIFLVNNRDIVYMRPGETSRYGFRFDRYDSQARMALIEDLEEQIPMPLQLGKKAYYPKNFIATVQDVITQASYVFSNAAKEYSFSEGKSIAVTHVNVDENYLVLVEYSQDRYPYAYKLTLEDANEAED